MTFLDSHQLTFHDCNEDPDIDGTLMVFKVSFGDEYDDKEEDDDEEEERR